MKEKLNQFMKKCKQNRKKTALLLLAFLFLFTAIGFGVYSLTTDNEPSPKVAEKEEKQEKQDKKKDEQKFNKDKIKEAERIIAQDREKNDKPVTSDFFGNSTNEHKIDLKEFKSDIKAITRLLSKDERILDSNELMAYYNHIRGLEEILKVNK